MYQLLTNVLTLKDIVTNLTIARQQFGKHIPAARNKHRTTE
jgi:hypothetical protein